MALSFKGGYRFQYSLPKDLTIFKTDIPSKLFIPVPGGFSVSIEESNRLQKGAVLATHTDGSILTASVSGYVASVSDTYIEIVPDSEQSTEDAPIAEKLSDIAPGEIVERMRCSGLVSESGFPMWRMFTSLVGCGEMLILNAAECEPGISCVHAMLRAYPEKVLGGLKIMMRSLALPKAIAVMTESMHHEARMLRQHLKHKGMLDILGVVEKYPLENPKVLYSAITGSRSAPSLQKAVLVTVRDCIAVYDLFVSGHAPSCRVVSIEGNNYEVYIGTQIADLPELCHLTLKENTVPHTGGLVSARKAEQNDCVGIQTKSVLYLSEHVFKNHDCIGCGKCSDCCPIGLLPARIWDSIQKKKEKALSNIDDCIECGVCTAVCYSEIDICSAIHNYRKFGFVSAKEADICEANCEEETVEYTQIGTIEEENNE